jgi:hypothetical protein|tara:strand:+ start:25 stop:1824 length:1800 start_codon:yes stop_codon:yes gene_type:complete
MPTLEELFKDRALASQGGQTAQEAYDIRNGNNIPLSSNSPIINGSTMKALNALRRSNGSTLEETVFEQETTGIRVLGTLSQPLLYGPELGRITLRSTAPLAEMKLDAKVGELLDGPIGTAFKKVRTFATKTLGIPTLVTPTYSKNFSDPIKGSFDSIDNIQKDYPKLIADIKDSGNGSLLGRLLKGGIGSLTDPSQLKSKVIGEALKFGKGLLRNKIVGEFTPSTHEYDFNASPAYKNGVKIARNYGPKKDNLSFSASGVLSKATSLIPSKGNYFDAAGASYSSFFKPTVTTTFSTSKSAFPSFAGLAFPSIFQEPNAENTAEENREFGLRKQSPFPTLNVEDLPVATGTKKQGTISSPIRKGKISDRAKLSDANKKKKKDDFDNFGQTKYNQSSFGHILNQKGVYKPKKDDTSIDDLDTIPLKFQSIHRGESVNFISTLSGLSETFSPSWDSHKFIGSPFSNYTYSGIERSVSFNFKVYALNADEHKIGWDKINFLNSLVLPQGYYNDSSAIVPPFIKLTIGDLYKDKEGFIESLSHTWQDSTPWNITDTETSILSDEIKMTGYKLPLITDVSITVKFLTSRNNTSGRKLYSFNPQTS